MVSPETKDIIEATAKGTLSELLDRLGRLKPSRQKKVSPFAPPSPDPDFVGREGKIKEVVSLLLQSNKGVYLHGNPGIGKSEIAKTLASENDIKKRFKKDIVWIGRTSRDLGQICNDVATALGISSVHEVDHEHVKIDMLRRGLEKRRVLVILDNADGPSAHAADRFAREITPCRVLATTRDSMDLQEAKIEGLALDEAVQLLIKKAAGSHTDTNEPLLKKIAAILEYHPFALSLAGRQLRDRSASDLFKSLNDRLLDPLFEPNNRDRSVRAAIEESYERLSKNQKHLLAGLGAFDADFDISAAYAALGRDVSSDLAILVGSSLVAFDRGSERHRLHNLIRAFAREKLRRWRPMPKSDLYKRMAFYYSVYASRHHQPKLEDYDALELERPNIFALLEWHRLHGPRDDKEWAAVVVGLNNLLAQFLDVRGFWEQRITYGDVAVECAEVLGIDARIAAIAHNVAIIHQYRGNLGKAEELYRRSLEIEEKLGNQQGIARSLHEMGIMAQGREDYPEAERLYRRSLGIKERLGDQQGIAQSFHQMGMLAQDTGNYPEAEGLYHSSLEINEKLGYQQGIAQTLHQLGMMAQIREENAEAERLYRRSLEIEEKLGNQDGMAISLHTMGLLKETVEDLPGAREYLRRALAIFERLGSPIAEQVKRDLERVEQKLGPRGPSSSSHGDG